MTLSTNNSRTAQNWRSGASIQSPAGGMYASGKFAEADMIGRTVGGSGRCGTVCSGSGINLCC